MQRLSDDEWIARARQRAGPDGAWQRFAPPELPSAEESARRSAERATAAGALRCPACESAPPLEIYRRYELLTAEPLRYCRVCLGFWAKGDSLARGVRDADDGSTAFTAALAPARCRACGGRQIDGDGKCRDCGEVPGPRDCPGCGRSMAQTIRSGVRLDECGACTATWFDTGEIGRVYGLAPSQGLAMRTVDEHGAGRSGAGAMMAAGLVLRAFFRLFPL